MIEQKDIKKVLLSEDEIKDIVKRMGKQITEDYKGKNLLVVSVLKGSIMFMADLMREIKIHCKVDLWQFRHTAREQILAARLKLLRICQLTLRVMIY